MSKSYLAVDLGASSGRVMAGCWTGAGFSLREVHRFANRGVRLDNSLYWDVLGIWSGVLEGMQKFRVEYAETPDGIGIDAWGVDFGLLDTDGRLLGNPYHYRDTRTDGAVERVGRRIDGPTLYRQTGVQSMSINTLYQLENMIDSGDSQLRHASKLLMIPDLFQYFLTHEMAAEYTEATTTQLFDPVARNWSKSVLETVGIRPDLFAPILMPGAVLGAVQPSVWRECGFAAGFPAITVASHDTASAVAAIPEMDDQSVFLSCGTWSLMGAKVAGITRSSAAYELGFTHEGAADGGVLCIRNLTGLWILQECLRQWAAQGKNYPWELLMQAAEAVPPHHSLIDTDAPEFSASEDMPAAIRTWCAQTGQPVPETDAETARCVLESLALKYRATLDDLEKVTARSLAVVRLVGGGARNKLLCQMTADACQRPVVAGPVEAAALGNVLVQAVATGHVSSLAEGVKVLSAEEELRNYQPQSGDRWQAASARLAGISMSRTARQ